MTYDSTVGYPDTTTISAFFDSRADADAAVEALRSAGISDARLRIVEGAGGAVRDADRDKGFWEALGDFFFPDEDRYAYAEGLSRGGYLVTATGLSTSERAVAAEILDREGTVDMDEREASWRAEGWGGYETSAYAQGGVTTTGLAGTAGTSAGMAAGMAGGTAAFADTTRGSADFADRDLDETIPVVEERLRVGKRDVHGGHVRIRAYTVEEPVSETVSLRHEHVELDRRPVDRPVGDGDLFQDRTIEAEEYREEAVVSKEARVVEEIGLRKTSDTRQETVTDTVRRTEVEVEDDRDGIPPRTGL